MLGSGGPDFPFTLMLTTELPTSRNGRPARISAGWLKAHLDHVTTDLDALRDPRAIRVDDKPLLVVAGLDGDDGAAAADVLRLEADKVGLSDLFLVGARTGPSSSAEPGELGLDAWLTLHPDRSLAQSVSRTPASKGMLTTARYDDYARAAFEAAAAGLTDYQTILVGWDEAPLNGSGTLVLTDRDPDAYGEWFRATVSATRDQHSKDRSLVFLASWNDWTHGAHLEPDLQDGRAYLEATKANLAPPLWAPATAR
jgi:hypothetical protein